MRTKMRFLHRTAASLYGALLVLVAQQAGAAIPLSDTPLFLTVSVPPNIVLTLDDSFSMRAAYVPEYCGVRNSDCATLDNRYTKSARGNSLYYDPNVTYPPPKDANGNQLTTSFFAAYRNGFDPSSGTVDLSKNYRPIAYLTYEMRNGSPLYTEEYMGHYSGDFRCSTTSIGGSRRCQYSTNKGSTWTTAPANTACNSDNACRGPHGASGNPDPAPMPAYYYVFDPTNANCNGSTEDNDCYDIRFVTSTSGPGGTDERQNFANWYSFARTRTLATQTAASLAFSELHESARLGWQALTTCQLVDNDCDGWKNNFSNYYNGVRPFTGTHKQHFFNWLGQLPHAGSTPLPQAMVRVGDYFKGKGDGGPYDNDFTTPNSGEHACRRNYHILMTDGIWTDGVVVDNQDNKTIDLPQPYTDATPPITQYSPMAPYRDSTANTLADVALKYALTDLRPDLDNIVAPVVNDPTGTPTQQYWNPRNDPYTWQHMVNFTIGLGLTSYLAEAGLTWTGDMYGGSYVDIAAGTKQWPATGVDNPGNVVDLWHAAINSRGQFFSADDPATLSDAFRKVLTAIAGDSGSSAALSANSTSIQPDDTFVFQARFNKDWSGTLRAYKVADDGQVAGTYEWDAADKLPPHYNRKIYTHNGSGGVEFKNCSALSSEQQTALSTNGSGVNDGLCQNRLDWLRGSHQDEQASTGGLKLFRNRGVNVMGDIINSDPAFVKALDFGYSNLPPAVPGSDEYDDYLADNAARVPMVYVGSNDGRMYAIQATTGDIAGSGVEIFSYVPLGVYPTLARLTDPDYTHRYYVDGGITAADAYLTIAGVEKWRSVVLGGLNAGGKTVYALDVTDPMNFDETNVMWEFTDEDMGLSFSQPQVGLFANSDGASWTWVAVFGNGYNSDEGGTYLYVVDLATGTLLQKLPVGKDAENVDDENGLSTPLLYDTNGDKIMDVVYVGDLKGNMWKIDVSGGVGSWTVAYGDTPLFTAVGPQGNVQPITAQPKAAGHPNGGTIVMFGTGRYLTASDVNDDSVQTFYGIRDNGSTVSSRTELLQQWLDLQQDTAFGREVRSVTNNTPDWNTHKGWYLDLLDPPTPPGTKRGERVVSTSVVREGRVIFVTVVPDTDPCKPGGTSWLMELDVINGGTFAEPVLDVNNDGVFDENDNVGGQVIGGVRRDELGISKTPVWLEQCQGAACKILTGTRGVFARERNKVANPPEPPDEPVFRRSWIQIR